MKLKHFINLSFYTYIFLFALSIQSQNNPVSDPTNNQGWIFNTEMSDEFNGTTLDKTKWWILGENNDYRNKWKGRGPAQYVGHNVIMDETKGDLIIQSQWEPNFEFRNEINNGYYYGGSTSASNNSNPITQACILSEKYFRYGYMEIRCKSANAPVTNAFWTTGYHSEIDVTENYAKRPISHAQSNNPNDKLPKKLRSNLISWDPDLRDTGNFSYHAEHILSKNTASDYFVFGFEWDKNYMKIYFEGQLLETITRTNSNEVDKKPGVKWTWDAPQEIWIDSEVFHWYGLPKQEDLTTPAEFRIDYVRIWQKELLSGNDFNALGFEGPFNYAGRSRNWSANGGRNWRMETEKPNSGDYSLRYKHTSTISANQNFYAPVGSLDLPNGSNKMYMDIWIDPNTNLNSLRTFLDRPNTRLDFNLSNIEKGKWVTVSQTFSRNTASDTNLSNGDRIRFQLRSTEIQGSNALFYIDNIRFERDNTALSLKDANSFDFNIYPNPAKTHIKITTKENSNIAIINSIGMVVKSIKKSKKNHFVSIENLSSGLYFIEIKHNKKIATKKLIIQ
jgi:hypothetical protein